MTDPTNPFEAMQRDRKATRVTWVIDARLSRPDPDTLEATATVIERGLWSEEEWATIAEVAGVKPLSAETRKLVITKLRDLAKVRREHPPGTSDPFEGLAPPQEGR